MPFLLVIGAAYACYAANADKLKKVKIDPTIKLKGKNVVALHEFEKEASLMELPVATLSFFEGNYREAAAHLERRVEEILQKNQWLVGWLLPMPEVSIVYDTTGQDRPPGYFIVFEPGMIPLKHDTPYELYSEELKEAIVPSNMELIGQNKPIWKLAVIPDAAEPDTKFAVLVSMSHAVGDAHTYYKIYNMLSAAATVEALNPVRVSNFTDSVYRNLGESETNFFRGLIKGGGAPSKGAQREAQQAAAAVVRKLSLTDFGDDGEEPSKESSPLLRSLVQHQQATLSEENVMKMFYVNEEWVLRRKGRRGSVFEADGPTASAAIVSANSIISSWFFRINQAAVGILMMNLRDRLPGCSVGDSDAGNYAFALICGEQDFSNAQSVQQVTQRLGRVVDGEPLQFDSDRNASMCVNWANFYRDDLLLADDCQQTLHIPIYNTAILQYLPDKVSAINLFTARCASSGKGRRAGAFVVCQEAVWNEIEQSGIVEEMIADV